MAASMAEDRNAYIRPDPRAVARLVASHGSDAARTRWWHIDHGTLNGLARQGRAMLGMSTTRGHVRPSSSLPEQRFVAVEASYMLGGQRAGERAAGLHENALIHITQVRGLSDAPKIAAEERGSRAARSKRASAGDAVAIAEMADIERHEIAVGDVLRIAWGFVSDRQPVVGRYVLPTPSPELAAALAGQDPIAVALAFPGLLASPVPIPPAPVEATPVPVSTPAAAWRPHHETPRPSGMRGGRRLVPEDDVIRQHHAENPDVGALSLRWCVSKTCVYQHLTRLGLYEPHRLLEAAAPAPAEPEIQPPEPAQEEAAASTEITVPERESLVRLKSRPDAARLGVDDLELAYRLAERLRVPPHEALLFVRADVSLSLSGEAY